MLNNDVEEMDRVRVYKSETADEHCRGFLARQFQLKPTLSQRKFDWLFGVGLPILCAAADPIVFRTWPGSGRALLADYQTFAYALSIVSIMSMAAWLLWGERLGGLRPYLAGLFITGSAISLIVGVALLPYSLLGMIVLIGFLGLTPLFSSFVYLRNGIRAIDSASTDSGYWVICRAVVLAILYSLIVPFVLNY